jgi:signal transduction histidine kinase
MREAVHELNNQLAVILNFAAFVVEDTPADDPRREDLEEILRAVKKAPDVAAELPA